MKIAYDAKRLFHNSSGLGNYSRDLIRMLSNSKAPNTYLLLSKSSSERGEALVKNPKVQFESIGRGKLARLQIMGKIAQQNKAQIFHGLSGELPLKWNPSPIKKVVTIHDLIFMRFPKYYSWIDRKVHFWKFKKAVEQADLILAISEQTKRDIITYLKADPRKIQVVYQGCHQAFKSEYDLPTLQALQEKYGLPPEFLLSVGTIEERKNLMGVVEALNELDDLDIPLVIVGRPTSYYKKVRKTLKRYGLERRVIHLSGVTMEELAGIYQLAKVFIYPSYFEGFGIPVIEALYSGTPVITSNNSCLREAGGEYSLYVDPYNSKDIAAKLRFLWTKESERVRRAEKGKLYAQRFNDELITSEILQLYEALLVS